MLNDYTKVSQYLHNMDLEVALKTIMVPKMVTKTKASKT